MHCPHTEGACITANAQGGGCGPDWALGLQADVTSSAALVQLLAVREAKLVGQLSAAMAGKHVDVFDTWMKRCSDLVQATAEASIGLVVVQAAQRSLAGVSSALRAVLDSVLRLDLLCRVRKSLDWFLVEGLVTGPEAGKVCFCDCVLPVSMALL